MTTEELQAERKATIERIGRLTFANEMRNIPGTIKKRRARTIAGQRRRLKWIDRQLKKGSKNA